jgi:hypothetical protein
VEGRERGTKRQVGQEEQIRGCEAGRKRYQVIGEGEEATRAKKIIEAEEGNKKR